MRTFTIKTLGCKVNQYESQAIRERFTSSGFLESDNGNAKVCVINTCTVTETADRKSLREIRSAINKNPDAKIIVTGCMVAKDKDKILKIAGIDCLIEKQAFSPFKISGFAGHNRAFLKIQDGCNNFCSYCKVPLVRGASVSKPIEEVIFEAKQLIGAGFKEIVLSGICLGAYGIDLQKRSLLVELLEMLEKIEGFFRIRLSSIEPNFIDDKLISKIAASGRVCPHLHIPLQSGSDKILGKMNRRYTYGQFIRLVGHIRKKLPDFSLTTDILVGFPGEQEKDFKNTIEAIKEIQPARAHIFPYSRRKHTAAYNFRGHIPQAIILQRLNVLKEIVGETGFEYRKRFLGKRLYVLIENELDKKSKLLKGYSENYILVLLEDKRKDLKNKIVPVKITDVTPDYSRGVPSLRSPR